MDKHSRFSIITSLMILLIGLVLIIPAQAEPVDDETCLTCHEGYDQTLAATVHRLASTMKSPSQTVMCASCHSGAEVHIEDPSVDNIGNPSRLSGQDAIETCSACHIAHVDLDNYGFDAHSELRLNCSGCHSVHGGNQSLLVDAGADFCYACHQSVKTQFARNSQHPVRQGNITCLSCHQFVARKDANLAYDLGRVCQDCHPQQAGPFLFEHEPNSAWAVEGSGCIECHEPHGSANDRLLRQSESNVCRQCHILPGHRLAHGGIYADNNCLSCHLEVHGSHTNRKLWDPAIAVKFGVDCFQSGCHSRN